MCARTPFACITRVACCIMDQRPKVGCLEISKLGDAWYGADSVWVAAVCRVASFGWPLGGMLAA